MGFQGTPQTKGEKEEDQVHYPVFRGTYIHAAKTVEGEKQQRPSKTTTTTLKASRTYLACIPTTDVLAFQKLAS
jgi:hypothetical protein